MLVWLLGTSLFLGPRQKRLSEKPPPKYDVDFNMNTVYRSEAVIGIWHERDISGATKPLEVWGRGLIRQCVWTCVGALGVLNTSSGRKIAPLNILFLQVEMKLNTFSSFRVFCKHLPFQQRYCSLCSDPLTSALLIHTDYLAATCFCVNLMTAFIWNFTHIDTETHTPSLWFNGYTVTMNWCDVWNKQSFHLDHSKQSSAWWWW